MKRLAILAGMFVIGCKGSKPVKDLDVYTYSVPIDQDPTVEHWISSTYTLRIGDASYAVKGDEVAVPKDVWLTKNPLMLVLDTTCGPRELPLKNIYSDELQMRRSAAKYDQAVKWKLGFQEAFEVKNIGIVVDNHDNPTPVTVRLGTISKTVEPSSHATIAGMLGTCDTAREIAIEGKVIGSAKTDGTSTLVDPLGTRCYLKATDWYGASAIEPSRDTLVAYSPGLYTIDGINNWFVANPTSTTVRVQDTESAKATAGRALTSLTHTACPGARR